MSKNFSDFVDWLEDEIKAGRLRRADIANTGFVKRPTVSALFKRKTKSLGADMCQAIAQAMNLQMEDIYRKAGQLPPKPNTEDPWMKEAINKLSKITNEEKRDIVSKILDAFTNSKTS